METLADVLAVARDRDGDAFTAAGRTTGYSCREFATTAWKAGNLFRHYGVRTGSRVAVVVGPKAPGDADEPGVLGASPDPLLATLGATLLGGVGTFDPDGEFDGDALVAPDGWLDDVETTPGCTRIAYGGPPEAPDVVHFEQATWSQNPVAPPEAEGLASTDPALVDGAEYSQGDLLDRARTVVDAHDLAAGDRVAVTGRVDADVFAAGIVAPLLAGATIVGGSEPEGDVVVGPGGDVDAGAGGE